MESEKNIYLIGYRCTGKTTIGRKLAEYLDFEFEDTDELIQQNQGQTVAQIVAESGWAYFRDLEKTILKSTGQSGQKVVSTGGGIILDSENRSFLMSSGWCVWLNAEPKTILQRLNKDTNTRTLRPALSSLSLEAETMQNLKDRMPLYEKTHHINIDTDLLTVDQCVQLIHRRLCDVGF